MLLLNQPETRARLFGAGDGEWKGAVQRRHWAGVLADCTTRCVFVRPCSKEQPGSETLEGILVLGGLAHWSGVSGEAILGKHLQECKEAFEHFAKLLHSGLGARPGLHRKMGYSYVLEWPESVPVTRLTVEMEETFYGRRFTAGSTSLLFSGEPPLGSVGGYQRPAATPRTEQAVCSALLGRLMAGLALAHLAHLAARNVVRPKDFGTLLMAYAPPGTGKTTVLMAETAVSFVGNFLGPSMLRFKPHTPKAKSVRPARGKEFGPPTAGAYLGPNAQAAYVLIFCHSEAEHISALEPRSQARVVLDYVVQQSLLHLQAWQDKPQIGPPGKITHEVPVGL